MTGSHDLPQAALVGVAATYAGELLFDTARTSRKVADISQDPHVAVVIGGWQDEMTVFGDQGNAVEHRGHAYARQ